MMRIAGAARARLRAARTRPDEGIAMLIVIMFMVMMLAMSLTIVSTIRSQPAAVYTSERSTKTLYAAQAGIQASLGQLRSVSKVVGGNTYGDRTKLPCSLSGSVEGGTGTSTYAVTITYYTLDPTGHTTDSVWRAANKFTCPFVGTTLQPAYALIESTGSAASIAGLANGTVQRKVQAVYVFNVSNVNIPGGRINDGGNAYCLEATTPTVGSTVTFQTNATCDLDTSKISTSWVYDTDWKIKLASSTLTATPLCITDPDLASATAGTTSSSNPRVATLQPCATGTAALTQQWSWGVQGYTWTGERNPNTSAGESGNVRHSSACLIAATTPVTAGTQLDVSSTYCNLAFNPLPAVGAGAASVLTHQIVNYLEFGRCADVTYEDINHWYMISYPCKQDPSGTGNEILWNHKWYYTEPSAGSSASAPEQITVNHPNGTTYCLTTASATASPAYPTFAVCNSSAAQKWVRVAQASNYASSWLFTDQYGRCLGVSPANYDSSGWSTLTTTTCDGSLGQKWNAPAAGSGATFGSYKEIAP